MCRQLIYFALVGLASTCLVPGAVVGAEWLTNGDFEETTGWGALGDAADSAPLGWRDSPAGRLNPASIQSGVHAIGGSGNTDSGTLVAASSP
jgi:hypothetical protein